MGNFLHDLAIAHQVHEGWFPGSKSYRQNNPGNLRGSNGVFLTFPSYAAGLEALKADLSAKIFGTAGSIKRYIAATKTPYERLVFQTYVAIYAPSADSNNPVAYCNALCKSLSQYHVSPGTPLFVLALLVRGEIQRVDEMSVPKHQMTMEQRLIAAEKALRFASPSRKRLLERLIERLKRILHIDPL